MAMRQRSTWLLQHRPNQAAPWLWLTALLIFAVLAWTGCGDGDSLSQVADEPEVLIQEPLNGEGPTLLLNGTPVFIQGAGGPTEQRPQGGFTQFSYSYVKDDMPAAGVNSIRTYGSSFVFDDAATQAGDVKAAFDFAKGASTKDTTVTVAVGLNLAPHNPNGTGAGKSGTVNYNDEKQVKAQYVLFTELIDLIIDMDQSYQLAWIVGNEVADSPDQSTREAVYKAIDEIAVYIKTIKKSTLPVMTAVPTVTATELGIINTSAPHLDWIGVNTFYGTFYSQSGNISGGGYLNTLAQTFEDAKTKKLWTKPWVVTEYYSYDLPGDNMPFQTINGNDVYLELNSTLNAQNYSDSYTNYIQAAQSQGCLGGYALNWMPPIFSPLPAFWKHMYVYQGTSSFDQAKVDRLECVQAVATTYGGSVSTSFPQIVLPSDNDPQGIDCAFKATQTTNPDSVAPGSSLTASVTATGAASFDWFIIGMVGSNNPDTYPSPSNYIGSGTTNDTTNIITFTAPQAGVYRLRVIARDGSGNAATASVPFWSAASN